MTTALLRRRRRLSFTTETGPTYNVSISGLTSNPTYGNVPQIGVELTAVANGYSGADPASVTWTWNNVTGTPAGTGNVNYTPVAGDNLEAISVTATPSDTYGEKTTGTYTVRYAPPAENTAPVAAGDPVIGESLTGTSGTFTGSDLTEGDEWQVSDDGSTGWAGTGDIDTTSPAQVSGKYYRFASTASNSGGSLTIYSNVIGPAVAASSDWILENGAWDDTGVWDDASNWKDAA